MTKEEVEELEIGALLTPDRSTEYYYNSSILSAVKYMRLTGITFDSSYNQYKLMGVSYNMDDLYIGMYTCLSASMKIFCVDNDNYDIFNCK